MDTKMKRRKEAKFKRWLDDLQIAISGETSYFRVDLGNRGLWRPYFEEGYTPGDIVADGMWQFEQRDQALGTKTQKFLKETQ